jgi:DNA-binding transcriptional ArsR family regulator
MRSVSSERRVKGILPTTPIGLSVDFGTAYELVLGLRMFVDADEAPTSYSLGPDWFERTRERLPAAALEAIERYSGGHEILFGYLLALAADAPAPRDAQTLIGALDQLPAEEVRRLLLGHRLETYRGGVPRETIAAAAEGDVVAARELLDGCLEWQRAPYEHVLGSDGGEMKRLLARSFQGWYDTVLAPEERTTGRLLKRSALATRALAAQLPAEEVVDVATRGIRYLPEPGIRRILLVPHVVSRPWSIFTELGDTKIVCYGLLDSQVSGDAPPDPIVAAYKALGDETRLRLLRRLAMGPATLQELTELTGLAKSTVHGHLLVLRTGGLVVADVSKKTGYRLRRETIAESAALLDSYLGTEE